MVRTRSMYRGLTRPNLEISATSGRWKKKIKTEGIRSSSNIPIDLSANFKESPLFTPHPSVPSPSGSSSS
ncbi:hypothetical protein U1Q18_033052 [Sarracenia purpurea var. burkii]